MIAKSNITGTWDAYLAEMEEFKAAESAKLAKPVKPLEYYGRPNIDDAGDVVYTYYEPDVESGLWQKFFMVFRPSNFSPDAPIVVWGINVNTGKPFQARINEWPVGDTAKVDEWRAEQQAEIERLERMIEVKEMLRQVSPSGRPALRETVRLSRRQSLALIARYNRKRKPARIMRVVETKDLNAPEWVRKLLSFFNWL